MESVFLFYFYYFVVFLAAAVRTKFPLMGFLKIIFILFYYSILFSLR